MNRAVCLGLGVMVAGAALAGCGQSVALSRPYLQIVAKSHPRPAPRAEQTHFTLAGISGNTWGTGTMSLSPATHVLTVTLSMQSLAVASHHAAMIHQGSCGRLGKALYALSPLVGAATGRAMSTTHISGIGAVPKQGWAVVVHQNMRGTGKPLACGTVGPNIGPS